MPGESLIGLGGPLGAALSGLSLLSRLGGGGGVTPEYTAFRRSTEGRTLEMGRRGEPTRDQLIASFVAQGGAGGPVIPGTAGNPPNAPPDLPPGVSPPGITPTGPTIGVGPSGLPVLGLPAGVLPGVMGQTATSTRGGRAGTGTSNVPRRYGDFDDLLERVPRGLRDRLYRIARNAVRAGIAFELVRRALSDVIFGIDPSELTPEQAREAEQAFRDEVARLEEITVGRTRRSVTDRRGLGGDIVVNVPQQPGGLGPPTWEQLPPGASPPIGGQGGPVAPAPTPREPLRVRIRRGIQNNLTELILGTLTLGSLRRSSSTAPNIPIDINVPTGGAAFPLPLTGNQPSVLTSSLLQRVGRVGQQTCECKKPRKSKRRKCLERGQIEWRSGRYKGKLAGTKCVRWSEK
jgi:hypothetical protein